MTKIVIGHGHWDHAGSLSDFPNAVLYVQRKELEGIDWALNYPEPHIRADNIAGCNRTPACGYPPKTLDEIYGKVLRQKAVIVDGEFDVLPGIKIHPAWHSHTAGAQLLEVRTGTSIGTLVFGSDTYSSWQGIRDWMVANIQSSTDSAQQFLAYEKCYKLTDSNIEQLHRRARADVLYGRVSDHVEFVGRGFRRLAHGRDHPRAGRDLEEAKIDR